VIAVPSASAFAVAVRVEASVTVPETAIVPEPSEVLTEEVEPFLSTSAVASDEEPATNIPPANASASASGRWLEIALTDKLPAPEELVASAVTLPST
jgi:hypothetical protein